ncbi:cupin domain-containing protein [Saccharothrix sp. HUAS TT1]|uniref:cupin domain-containing protein n=1 Tax=unclassified Saccharothrix TaxID=2593673 RepID=UPI00345B6150
MRPPAGGPAAHFHKTFSESFHVISGTVRLYDGETWVNATAGDFLYVPEGGVHAFRNDSDDPASMLILFAPRRRARSTSGNSPRSVSRVGSGIRPPAVRWGEPERPAVVGHAWAHLQRLGERCRAGRGGGALRA